MVVARYHRETIIFSLLLLYSKMKVLGLKISFSSSNLYMKLENFTIYTKKALFINLITSSGSLMVSTK